MTTTVAATMATTVAAMMTMATITPMATAMATMAAVAAMTSVTAAAAAATAKDKGRSLVFTAHEGDSNQREKDRETENNNTIHPQSSNYLQVP